jgi:hypothetical protein
MPRELHPARLLHEPLSVVFTAQSACTAFMRHHICKFVLQKGCVPINPFMSFDYFLLDSVPRDSVRQANNTLLQKADELWTFGVIADGVLEEIRLARKVGMPIKHYSLGKDLESIARLAPGDLEYDPGVARLEDLAAGF